MKRREDLLAMYTTGRGCRPSQKRQRDGKEPDVQEALALWLEQKVLQGANVSGLVLSLAAKMGKDFTPSDGWLSLLTDFFPSELEKN